MMEKPNKVYVSGTGRCGTTFLMIVFSILGLDTGYGPEDWSEGCYASSHGCTAGLEKGDYLSDCYIIKSPSIITQLKIIIPRVNIDYMIIPIRNYYDSSVSREKNGLDGNGGLWNAKNIEEQERFYNKIISEYLYAMTIHNIPTIFINFEKMISDSKYLYKMLKPIFKGKNITYSKFKSAYKIATVHQTELRKIYINESDENGELKDRFSWDKDKWIRY